jgi:hypothetical protein
VTLSARPVRRAFFAAVAISLSYACTAWFAAPTRAQAGATPTPDCSGIVLTDPSGDQGIPQGAVPIIPAGPNLDLTGVFFRYDAGTDAKSPVTVNIQVANLSKDLPLGGSAASWYAEWNVADVLYYAKADMDDGGAITYDYGIDDPNLGLTSSGATSGKFVEGEKGVVQIVVPQSSATKATDGSVLKQTEAHTSVTLPGLLVFADSAPDSGTAKNYTVAQCPGAETAPTAPTTTTTTTQPDVLPITLGTSSAKASKGKKGKSLAFKLKSTEEVTGITATFKKGSTSYGSGKLAKLKSSGTLKVKLKKALKKGTYKLQLKGTTAAGKGKATFSVKVR